MESYYRAQLRLAIGGEAFDAIPDREERKLRPLRVRGVQRRPRIEARQRMILGGFVPAKVAAGYTVAQIAVLYVIAVEHQRHGCCKLTVGRIAYLAQCCETVVHNTFRQATRLGDLQIKHRRVSRYYSLPNVIMIMNRTWLAWLRLGPRRSRPWGEGGIPEHKDKGASMCSGTGLQQFNSYPNNGAGTPRPRL
jgi:hypothetical protein